MQSSGTDGSMPATEEAVTILCKKHLHQCFWLPENESHGRLRITYSTTSNFTDTALPVILFLGPMFGSRYLNNEFNQLAISTGVRVICVDRPGMGGATPVPLKHRINVWLETVPALLKLLHVEYVSLMSHSAGTVYCLNTLYHLRDLLEPTRPYVAFIGPWVHSEHSQKVLWNMASKLPASMIGSWNSLAKFIQLRIAPSVSWSGSVVSAVSGLFGDPKEDPSPPGKTYGTSDEVGKEIERLRMEYFFAEDTTAANEEAMLLLKKDRSVGWGVCDDYHECVRTLCSREQQRRQADSSVPKLVVRVFFAESDVMIGKGGQKYFDDCWKQDGVSDAINYESKELAGTDHDSALIDQEKGALKAIFGEVGRGC